MTPSPTPERAFLFSYEEHEIFDDVSGADDAAQVLLQQARRRAWLPTDETLDPDACEDSLAALREEVESLFGSYDDGGDASVRAAFAEAARAPFEKLEIKMRDEGWAFVGGYCSEFEGNHNDTEICVILRGAG